MEAMKGTGEERCSRQRRDVRRGDLEDCRERRIWIRINFLPGYIFILSRNLSSCSQCERHHDRVRYRHKTDRAERQQDEKWSTFSRKPALLNASFKRYRYFHPKWIMTVKMWAVYQNEFCDCHFSNRRYLVLTAKHSKMNINASESIFLPSTFACILPWRWADVNKLMTQEISRLTPQCHYKQEEHRQYFFIFYVLQKMYIIQKKREQKVKDQLLL